VLESISQVNQQEEVIQTILRYSNEERGKRINPDLEKVSTVKLLRTIWRRFKEAITVEPGFPETSTLPMPNPSWKVKRGNVADIALFFGYMLKHFEIDYVFRFAGYREYGVYEHLYTVAITNDVEYVLDLTAGKFNREHRYLMHADR